MDHPARTQVDAAVEALRHRLQRELRGFLTGGRPPARDLSAPHGAGGERSQDLGWFGPDSVTWRVHADASMLVGGLRALLLQTMHPLAMAGVAQHSAFRADPMGRLWRTAAYIGMTSYGTSAQAEAAVRQVHRAHRPVRGTAPDGRAYSAADPHLMSWVQLTLVDSFLRAYERYGADPLSAADADRYVDEQRIVATKVGATQPAPPRSRAELREQMRAFRPELRATRAAREAVRFLLVPPLPLAARAPYAVIATAAVGTLPAFVRRQLWLPRLPVTESLVVPLAARPVVRAIDWVMRPPLAS